MSHNARDLSHQVPPPMHVFASITDLPTRSRNRSTVSCTACHRRKQKCDRGLPCSNCVARNVGDQCGYEAPKPLKRRRKVQQVENEVNETRSVEPFATSVKDVEQGTRQSSGLLSIPQLGDVRGAAQHPESTTVVEHSNDIDEGFVSASGSTGSLLETSSNDDDDTLAEEARQANEIADIRIAAARALRPAMLRRPKGTANPFNTLPLEMDQMTMNELLIHYDKVVGPFLSLLSGEPVVTPYTKYWLPIAIRDVMPLSATLYIASSNLDGLRKMPLQPRTLALKSLTLREINQSLQECKGEYPDELMLSILCLGHSEFTVGEIASSKAHFGAIADLVKARGGLGALGVGGVLANLIATAALQSAITYEEEPLIAIQPGFNPAIVDYGLPIVPMHSPLSYHFRPFVPRHKTLGLLRETAEIIDLVQEITQHLMMTDTMTGAEILNFEDRCRTTSSRIETLSLEDDLTPCGSRRDVLVHQCVHITGTAFLTCIINHIPFSSGLSEIAFGELSVVLLTLGRNLFDEIPGVLYWICLTAVPRARSRRAMRTWYAVALSRYGSISGLTNWNETIYSLETCLNVQRYIRGEPFRRTTIPTSDPDT